MKLVYILGAISTFVMVFGMEGRGNWSKNIAIVGGLMWTASIVFAFYSLPWKSGLLFVFATFVFGVILEMILRPILNPHGH